MRTGVAIGLLLLGAFAAIVVEARRFTNPQPLHAPHEFLSPAIKSPAVLDESDSRRTWKIPFVTNAPPSSNGPDQRLRVGRFGALSLGVCQVDVPKDRMRGSCKVAPVDAEPNDPEWQQHIVRYNSQTLSGDRFFDDVADLVEMSQDRDLLLFVHGYNVSSHEAACRAAQLAEDIPFNGAVICFSWPSEAAMSGYASDAKMAEVSPWALASLLARLRQRLDDDAKIHVVAHSMGNRVLLGALHVLRGKTPDIPSGNIVVVGSSAISDDFAVWRTVGRERPPLGHVVFAAPDVESESFKQAVSFVRPVMQDATLYASSWDVALLASSIANLGASRAGDANDLVLLDGLMTIDASSARHNDHLGHSYYGTSNELLTDLFYLLKHDRHPDERPGLTRQPSWHQTYWRLAAGSSGTRR